MVGFNAPIRMLAVNAGLLREQLELQNPPQTNDGSGGQTGGWTKVATVRGQVVALSGDEAVQAAVVTGITRYHVMLRKRPVDTSQRLVWEGQALNIRSVVPDPGRQFVTLICEGVPIT